MKTNWVVATYKINEAKRVQSNLLNQNFEYYLPKVTKKKINSKSKEEILFPGYIFVCTTFDNYSALKYTLGIKNVIKFGDSISCISIEEINNMRLIEEASKKNPVTSNIEIGQDVIIAEGSFKGSIAKVSSLPSKERVDILLFFLGSKRRVNMPENFISLK